MVIGIDGNEANTPIRVGVGQYAFNLLTALSKTDSSNRYVVYLKNQPLPDMPKPTANWQYVVFGPGKLWTRFALPLRLFFDRRCQLFYSPSHYSPYPSIVPTIPTIHDIGYLNSLKEFNQKDIYQLVNWTSDSLRQAKHVVAVSEFTKNELIKTYHLPAGRISVCPNGVGEPPKLNSADFLQIKQKFKITSPYFLAVGTLKPNKNYSFLIRCFKKYLDNVAESGARQSYQLVIAGKKGWIFDEIFQTVQDLHLKSQVIFTDFIDETEKWQLYHNTIATVIPSLYEGFGIPAIESQKIGTPVIASNIPSLNEVLKASALFIDPTKEPTLIDAFAEIQKPNLRHKLIRLGFVQSSQYTWDKSAKSLDSLFQKLG